MGCGCKTVKRELRRSNYMLTMLDRETVPNGGYSFLQAETRTRLTAATLRHLAETVITHRQSNSLPTGSVEAVMVECENQICATAPPGTCRDVQGQVISAGINLSFEDVKRGTATLVDWFLHGKQKVAKPLAEERARICSSCFANKEPEGCSSCSGSALREIADKIVGGDSTAHDGFLKACAFCSCQLRAKIWLPLEVLLRHTPDEQKARLPEYCWIKKESL